MNWLDISVIVLVVLSALFGVSRGLVREALALGGWVVAIWVALEFAPGLAEFMTSAIAISSLRYMVAFLMLFLVTLILAAVLNHLISQTVRKSKLNGTDRTLGAVFGVIRGIAIVAVLTWLVGFTKLPQHASWKQSVLVGYFEEFAGWMRATVPPDLVKKLG